MAKKTYSIKKTLIKGIQVFVCFILPFLVDKFIVEFPEIAQLTIGSALVMLVNYLKNKVGVKFP